MDSEIRVEEGFFTTKDHLRMFWRAASPPAGAPTKAYVILQHGYCDHSGRYKECLRQLALEGFAVHTFDMRGHGQSDGRRGHCDSFLQYEDDLALFLERIRPRLDGKKLFLLGQGLGGLVIVHYGLARPSGVAGMALTSPTIRLAIHPSTVKQLGAQVMARLVPWLPFRNDVELPMLSHDADWLQATERDPLYLRVVTARWFFESSAAQDEVARRASEFVFPSLLLAGGDDPVASTPATRDFFGRITSADKQLKEYPGMLHEILSERGKDQVYRDLLGWLNARA
jgi:lysophospholipase